MYYILSIYIPDETKKVLENGIILLLSVRLLYTQANYGIFPINYSSQSKFIFEWTIILKKWRKGKEKKSWNFSTYSVFTIGPKSPGLVTLVAKQ